MTYFHRLSLEKPDRGLKIQGVEDHHSFAATGALPDDEIFLSVYAFSQVDAQSKSEIATLDATMKPYFERFVPVVQPGVVRLLRELDKDPEYTLSDAVRTQFSESVNAELTIVGERATRLARKLGSIAQEGANLYIEFIEDGGQKERYIFRMVDAVVSSLPTASDVLVVEPLLETSNGEQGLIPYGRNFRVGKLLHKLTTSPALKQYRLADNIRSKDKRVVSQLLKVDAQTLRDVWTIRTEQGLDIGESEFQTQIEQVLNRKD
jgi:hypothetical protein